ncbi:MAG: flagellar hook-length control protein FliK [Acidobacteriota bacterium]
MPQKTGAFASKAQPSSRDAQLPAVITARQFQPGPAGIQLAEGSSALPLNTTGLSQLLAQGDPSGNKHGQTGTGPEKEPAVAPLTPHPTQQDFISTGLPLVLSPLNQAGRDPRDLLQALDMPVNDAAEPAAAALPAQGQAQDPSKGPALQVTDKHLQTALNEMENVQLSSLPAAAPQARPPLPASPQAAKVPAPHQNNSNLSPDSANGIRQEPAKVNLQNSGRDNGVSNASALHDGASLLQTSTPAAGSSSDARNEGKSGQDSSARHPETSATPGSGPGSASGSFSSATASAMATSANRLATVPGQITPANATPVGAGSLPQPAASHAAGAVKLTSPLESPPSPASSVVNSASLLQAQGKTEMRVALQTDSLGPVELHAVLDSGRVGASIAVVNHEAHTLLTNNLPALQQTLTDQNVRLDHLSVLNTPMNSGTNTGAGGGSHSGTHSQSGRNTPGWAFSRPTMVSGNKESSVTDGLRGRLSVHA